MGLENNEDYIDTIVDSFNKSIASAFGENMFKAYGEGKYEYPILKYDVMGDTMAKDMAMVILRPISIAIAGAITIAVGLIKTSFNILPALAGNSDSKLVQSLAISAIGASMLMLATLAPLARLFNLSTRAYASLSSSKDLDYTTNSAEDLKVIKAIDPSNSSGPEYQKNIQALEERARQLIPHGKTQTYRQHLEQRNGEPATLSSMLGNKPA